MVMKMRGTTDIYIYKYMVMKMKGTTDIYIHIYIYIYVCIYIYIHKNNKKTIIYTINVLLYVFNNK